MNRFRCQYQKGNLCVSETIENEKPITSAQMVATLAKLALSVAEKVSWKKGLIVALQVLKIHEYVFKNMHNKNCRSTGASRSFYLNKKGTNKIENSERVDIECYGDCAFSDKTNILDRYVEMYRKSKGWDK